MIGRWVLFENDKCEKCKHPKVALITPGDTELQVIISCDCDTCVFDHQWKGAQNSDELIVVVESTVNDMLEILAKAMRDSNE